MTDTITMQDGSTIELRWANKDGERLRSIMYPETNDDGALTRERLQAAFEACEQQRRAFEEAGPPPDVLPKGLIDAWAQAAGITCDDGDALARTMTASKARRA